jgi:DNA-binding response OmpR family regulator
MNAKVLVVDDDPSVAEALRHALQSEPITLDVATDVPTATRYLDERHYCGMILDLVLDSSGSGFDVLHHVRQRGTPLPTVIVSSKLPDYVREMLDDQHVKLVFPKPVEPKLLAAIVMGLCGIAV